MPSLHKLAGALIVCAVIMGLLTPSAWGPAKPVRGARVRTASTAAPLRATGVAAAPTATGAPTGAAAPPTAPAAPPTAPPQAAAVQANELGEVPVLMYHRILVKPISDLDRTPAQLTAELDRLAREGYVPVTAAEYVAGRM
ncbi:MAG TPA: polysaccharide deacetylase, partial [Streptosporangiaceae bacterium]|nr:polysaccharide deacetylase [Streptosporangiaceae bacterium]